MSHELVDWDEDDESTDLSKGLSEGLSEGLSSKEGLVLKLGDIIETFAPSNAEYHEKTFFIDYIDDHSIEILDVTSGFKHTLTMYETGQLTEESISQIHLLSRAPEEGYVRQNGLTTGKWINVHFGGEIPTVITGEITNVDEDMIEIITYPDMEVIYLNFEYRGIPKNLPIEKIEIREIPKSIKGSLRQMVDALSEEGEIPDFEEFASMDISETGEIAIIIPDKPRMDPNFNDTLKELIINVDEIIFGEEEEIEVRTEVKRSEQRYGIDIQLNDLLDELLSTIPTYKQTSRVMARIHTVVRRFKELREQFSIFDENGNVTGYNNFDAAYKPVVEHLSRLDRNLRWILPVVKQQTKLYNVEEGFDADNVSKKTYITDVLEMQSKKQLYPEYSAYYENLNENMTPMETFYECVGCSATLEGKAVRTDLDAIVENLDNYYSHVHNKVNKSYQVGTRRFVMQKYNLGLSKMQQHIMKSGKTVYLRSQMTLPDKMHAKSVIMLPDAAIDFSRVDLPGTSVLDRVNKSHNWLYYHRLLRGKTDMQTISANQAIEDVPGFLEFVTDFETDGKMSYEDILKKAIPRSRSIITMMRDRIPDPYSFHAMISFFEPFLLYPDNITYSAKTLSDKRSNANIKHSGSYQEIRYFVKEMVKKYKAEAASKGAEFGEMGSKKYEKEGKIQESIYRVLKENSEFLKMVKERYPVVPGTSVSTSTSSSSEILTTLLNVDGGSAYMATVSLMLGVLFKPDLSRILASNSGDIEASILKTKSCATRSIAKQYKSVRDMQKDNDTEDVFFDKQYDDVPYNIMDKYQEEKGKMLPERFIEYLKMVLVEKHNATEETAEELAINLIAGRRRIRPGNYAMLSIVPVAANKDSIAGVDVTAEENARKKTSFYVRHKNTWIREDVDEETFCNLSPNCYTNSDGKKKTCDSAEYTEERLKKKDLASTGLDVAIDLTMQDMTEELKARAKYHLDLLKKIRWIKDSAAKQQNIFFYMMGTQVAENTIVESPYTKLRDYILGQSDFPKRHADIMRFRDHFCRDAVMSDTVAESEHWLYCVDTNSKLLPKFLYELAYSYVVSNNYEDELDRVCRHIGKLSEDHDAIVDRHSGYVIKQIDFVDEDEYNEAGFKVSHADIMTASAGESLLATSGGGGEATDISPVLGRKTKAGKKVFEDINTQHIYNIASSLCEYMGVDFDIIEERIMLLSIEFVKNLDSAEIYKAKQEKAAKKNIKIVSYQTYFDQNKLYFTACLTFVAIQTAIPSFTPRKTFPGCVFSFGGYPLEAGEENNVGIKYLACVIENVKSSIEPWNSIGNQKRDVIVQRLMELMSKRVTLNSDVADLYLRKKQHMDEHPDAYAIPPEHAVSKWTQFQPPIVKIGMQGSQSQGLSSEFKEDLGLALKKGDKSQQDMLGTVYGKIIANSYGVIENVNTIVAIFGKEALLRAGSIVFLENACCEDDAKSDVKKRKALDFFIDKDASIAKSIESVKTYSEIYNDAKKLVRASYLFHPMEGKKTLDIEKKFSEEQIYSAFIHYCKLTVDAPVPDDLLAFYPDKPHLDAKDLPQMIEKLKGLGHTHSQKSLQDLMQTVAYRNKVNVDLTEKKVDYGVAAFVDLVEHLSNEKVIETPLANHIMKLVDLYKDGVLPSSKVDALNVLKRYLMKANRTMLVVINKYIVDFSSMRSRDKNRISSFLANVGSWASIGSEDTELMFKSSQFIKNCVHATAKVVPSMLLNADNFAKSSIGLFNASAMKHWELSEIHERNIVRNISDYYGKLNVYQKDEMVCQFFRDMEVMLVNLNLFAENIPIFADQQLLFDRETVQMLYIYIYYSVFHDLIVESNNEEYVKVEMAKVKQMRRALAEDATVAYASAGSSTVAYASAASSIGDEEDLGIGDEYNILVGKQQDFKRRICQLFTILIEMDMDNKSIINVNYNDLSDKIYKANQAEKKTITDRFERMSIEERSVENAMKNYKIGAWNAGEEKGLFIYDKRTYNKEVTGQMMANVAGEGADVADLNAFDEANADADADREAFDIDNLGENYEDGAFYEEDMEREE